MAFLIIAFCGEDSHAIRARVRAEHIEYMLKHVQIVTIGGGITSDDQSIMTGMMIVLDVDSRQEAEAFLAAEPYNVAGMFHTVRIETFVQRLPETTPGFLLGELARERQRPI